MKREIIKPLLTVTIPFFKKSEMQQVGQGNE